jgi:hypothetical protein
MYSSLVLSGIFLMFDPSRIVTLAVPSWVGQAWTICMVASALICLYGAVTDRWLGEYTGIPLLASVMLMYGGSALSVAKDEPNNTTLIGFGLILVGFGCGLWARWKDVETLLTSVNDTPGFYSKFKTWVTRRR